GSHGRAARGALVRVFAPGVTPLKAKTNRSGRVTFRVKKLSRGKRLVLRKLRFRAAKTGFLTGRRTIATRYHPAPAPRRLLLRGPPADETVRLARAHHDDDRPVPDDTHAC